jgi:hypothetical protein
LATTVIRDYALATGGGHAIVHVEGCRHLRRTATEEQAMSPPGVWVSEQRSVDRAGWQDPRTVAVHYQRQFSVAVDVHFCPCAERAITDLDARLADYWADDEG